MINPIDNSASYSVLPPAEKKAFQKSYYHEVNDIDVVDISDESKKMHAHMANSKLVAESQMKATREDRENDGWKLPAGMKNGEFMLKNGNKQVVSIEDDKLEIQEFKNGKLVKSVTGVIHADGASLDTEYYDAAGRVSQSIHTDIRESPRHDDWTAAVMQRTVQWYENGKLSGEMQDDMMLESWNSATNPDVEMSSRVKDFIERGTEAVSFNVEELAHSITHEKHIANYFADIKEYGDNNKLARHVVLEHEGRYEHVSNRGYEDVVSLKKRTTRELEHETKLSLEIQDYDSAGKLVREASFRDVQKDKEDTSDGKQEQTVDVAWYNNGEMVKRSYGDMSLHETMATKLMDRPGMLETFDLDDESYLGEKPQSAMDMLNRNLMKSSSEPEFFMEGLRKHIADDGYGTAEGIASNGNPYQPYSINWTDEVYKNGELVVRQKDTERARENVFFQQERGMLFQTGRALTENDAPFLLRASSHEREVFEAGRLQAVETVDSRESVDLSMDAPDQLVTNTLVTKGVGNDVVTTAMRSVGELTEVDSDPNAAARGLSNELNQTLTSLYETISRMDMYDVGKNAMPVFLDYRG